MGKFSAKQLKAIGWYLQENPDLKLQLSSPPKVYFKNKRNKLISMNISDINGSYDVAIEEDRRERARQRNQNKV